MNKTKDFKHIYMYCPWCDRKVRVCLNRGTFWDTPDPHSTPYEQDVMTEFLADHSDCPAELIEMKFER